MTNAPKQLDLFLEPESIAVIGASRRTGATSFNIFENLVKSNYRGEVYPVNPKADEILGNKAYNKVETIENDIDLAVISTPRDPVVNLVKGCVEKNIKAIIIIGQGFSDAGGKGQKLEAELTEIAENSDTRIMGPNTLGVMNYRNRLSTAFFPVPDRLWGIKEKWDSVGIICQTGFFLRGILGINFGKAIDIGNSCDIDHVDALRYFKEDPDIEQILLHIEGLKRGKEFMKLAEETTKEKTVLVLKTGKSKKGSEMATSHTGSLTGEDRVYAGVLKQTGITRVKDLREVEIFLKGLLNLPKMKGNKVAVISTTGAAGIIAADALEEFGLEIAELSEETISKIQDLSPEWMTIKNPVDIWPAMMVGGKSMGEAFGLALAYILEDENVDGVISISPLGENPEEPNEVLTETINGLNSLLQSYEKPVASWLIHQKANSEMGKDLMKVENLAVFDTIREAIKTLSFLSKEYRGES